MNQEAPGKKIDQVFKRRQHEIKAFEFNQTVANVFDDMVSRSVPFYDEIHRLITDYSNYFTHHDKKNIIIDLGCSTGTTIGILHQHLVKNQKECRFIGIDNSQPMIDKAKEKLNKLDNSSIELVCQNIEDAKLENDVDMIIMNYTLQFILEDLRPIILKEIFKSLRPGGVFILSEKINTNDSTFHQLITDLYYDYKRRQGYSELEISQKREALENVLTPLTPNQQIDLLKNAGFNHVEQAFRWYNFTSYIALK